MKRHHFRFRQKRPFRQRVLSFNQLLPNIMTVSSLCMGLNGIRFALSGQWEYAVAAILIAGVLDGMDGRLARLLRSTSVFGAELDSLADFVNFGVAPALVIYLYALHQCGKMGWIACIFFVVCMAMRLARFNTRRIDETSYPGGEGAFSTGVPAPAGAVLTLSPLIITFEVPSTQFLISKFYFVALIVVGLLMISRIPTFTLKSIRFKNKYIILVLGSVGGAIIALGTFPWRTLLALAGVYIMSIAFSIRSFNRIKGSTALDQTTAE